MQTLKLTKKYEIYPEYKDSGVEWLGKIPKDWSTANSRRLFNTKKEAVGLASADYKVLSLTLRGVIPKVMDGSGKNPAEYDTYQAFKKDDLVFCLFDYDVTPRTIGYVQEDGMMTGAYTRLIPKSETYSKYFYYYFLSLDYTKELLHLCTGLRNSLSKPIFWSMKSSLPSLEDQKKIVTYLDEKTSLIDQTISKKQKLIDLLREKRTAVINQAVIKGLDLNVEMVESRIEWIGKIPKGWHVNRLKNISLYCSRGGAPDYTEDENAYKFINQSCIRDGFLDLEKVKYSLTPSNKGLVKNGDLLINSTGTGTLGRIGILKDDNRYFADTHVTIFRPNKTNSDFLMYLLQDPAWQDYLYASSVTGSTNQIELSRNRFLEIPVLLPNREEQNRIAEFLNKQTKLIGETIQKVEKSIELLQEFKSSLISNVVTGKIKIEI